MSRYVAAGLLVASFAAHAQACTAIHFAPGKSSAVVKGIASSTSDSGEITACYTLATGNGQTATIKLVEGPKDDAAFSILDVVDDHDQYTFMTEAKTYTINVFRTFAREPDEPFTMQVSVR